MSYRAYAVSTYGLVLSEEELHEAAKKFCDTNDEFQSSNLADLCEWEICDELGLECITDFNGEICGIDSKGRDNWSDCDSPSDVYYYGLKDPMLAAAAYHNIDEIVNECRAALGGLLPQDFDYRSHIRHIIGVVYG